MCSVCEHPNREDIEKAIDADEPVRAIARAYEISKSSVFDHKKNDHKSTRPYKPRPPGSDPMLPSLAPAPKPPKNPFPTNAEIAQIEDARARSNLLFRYFAERRWKGGRTVALLAHLWRRKLGDRAEEKVAEMAADAAMRHQRLRGPRHLRREELITKAQALAEKAEDSGKYADALACLKFVAELDGLAYEPGVIQALVEAQAWRLIKPLIEREAPHLIEKIDRTLARADQKQRKAIRQAETGLDPEDLEEAEPALPPAEERRREELVTIDAEAEVVEEQPDQGETFAAPRNGGRRPRAEAKDDEGSDEG